VPNLTSLIELGPADRAALWCALTSARMSSSTQGPARQLTAALGAAAGAPSTDLVRVESGDYTVVCVRSATDTVELEGISSLSVR